jgi:hypothetical protein
MQKFIFAALCAAGMACAQDVPQGWKTVTDMQKVCRLAVPTDWTSDKLLASFVMSPDKKDTAVAHGQRAGTSFQEAVALAKQMQPPTKTFEDSSSRAWWAYATGNGKPGTEWYVAVPGPQVCTATITFDDPAFEANAKKIVLSLKYAK